jgi:hypothetical protein
MPLGEHWPFSPQEFDWEKGKRLPEARRLLGHLIAMLEAGRGDEVLLDPTAKGPSKRVALRLESSEALKPEGASRPTSD